MRCDAMRIIQIPTNIMTWQSLTASVLSDGLRHQTYILVTAPDSNLYKYSALYSSTCILPDSASTATFEQRHHITLV